MQHTHSEHTVNTGIGFEVGQVTSVCSHVRCWNHTFGLGKIQGPHGRCATASTARLWLREGKLRVDQAEQTQQNQQTQNTNTRKKWKIRKGQINEKNRYEREFLSIGFRSGWISTKDGREESPTAMVVTWAVKRKHGHRCGCHQIKWRNCWDEHATIL